MHYSLANNSLNPYFIGLPILISNLCYRTSHLKDSLNPYFIGLPILINYKIRVYRFLTKVSILILLDYLFLFHGKTSE